VTAPRPNLPVLVGAAVACVLLIVGAVGTWQVLDANVLGIHVHRTATGTEHGSDGPIVIGMAVITGVMLLCYLLVPGKPVWAPIVALVIAVLAVLTSVADTIDVASRSYRSPGWGLYLDMLAAIGLAVACALLVREAVLHGRAVRAARPVAPWPGQTQAPAGSAAPAAAPAGWHPDPWGQRRLRYWDGAQWTGHTAD
jgi:Protein of unknown function (DUF2510)